MGSTIQVHMAKRKPQSSPVVAIWASRGSRRVAGGATQAQRDALAVRAPGVTLSATMRRPLVPRLSTDAMPHRMPIGRAREAYGER